MTCTRCNGLMVVDDLVDLQESCLQIQLRGLRCVSCGNVVDPLIMRNRMIQQSGAMRMLKTGMPLPAFAGSLKATA